MADSRVGIYKIRNKINNKIYIGQSTNIGRRWSEHKSKRKIKAHSTYPINKAFLKYGVDSFEFSIIEECLIEELNEREVHWIKYHSSNIDGYNATIGGTSSVGEDHPRASLTNLDVIEIRERRKLGEDKLQIFEDYPIKYDAFCKIWDNKTWNNVIVEGAYSEENKQMQNKRRLEKSIQSMRIKNGMTDESILNLREKYMYKTAKELYEEYTGELSLITFQQILGGITHKNLPIYKKKEGLWVYPQEE